MRCRTGPAAWAMNGEPGALVRRPPAPTAKLSIRLVLTRIPTRCLPDASKSTWPSPEPSGTETGRGAQRRQPAVVSKDEAGVVGASVARVGHVDQVAVDGDTDRLEPPRAEGTAGDRPVPAPGADPGDRDSGCCRRRPRGGSGGRRRWPARPARVGRRRCPRRRPRRATPREAQACRRRAARSRPRCWCPWCCR